MILSAEIFIVARIGLVSHFNPDFVGYLVASHSPRLLKPGRHGGGS